MPTAPRRASPVNQNRARRGPSACSSSKARPARCCAASTRTAAAIRARNSASTARKGSIRGTIGLMYDYPRGRADTLELNSRALPTDGWLHYPVTSRWIPDGLHRTDGITARSHRHGWHAAHERPGQPRHAADRACALSIGRRTRSGPAYAHWMRQARRTP